jgi:hypothetical protein
MREILSFKKYVLAISLATAASTASVNLYAAVGDIIKDTDGMGGTAPSGVQVAVIADNTAGVIANADSIAGNVLNITDNAANIIVNTGSSTANALNIAGNTSSITATEAEVANNVLNTTNNEAKIADNVSSITDNEAAIDVNSSSTAENKVAITDNVSSLTENAANIADNILSVADNASSITENEANIATNAMNIADNSGQIHVLNDRVEMLKEKAIRGIAISNAMQVFLPDPGKSFRINLGGGFYGGAQAIGFTGAGRISDDTAVYFGVGRDSNAKEVGGKVGVSFQW